MQRSHQGFVNETADQHMLFYQRRTQAVSLRPEPLARSSNRAIGGSPQVEASLFFFTPWVLSKASSQALRGSPGGASPVPPPLGAQRIPLVRPTAARSP